MTGSATYEIIIEISDINGYTYLYKAMSEASWALHSQSH